MAEITITIKIDNGVTIDQSGAPSEQGTATRPTAERVFAKRRLPRSVDQSGGEGTGPTDLAPIRRP
jgi:hypothetical protein